VRDTNKLEKIFSPKCSIKNKHTTESVAVTGLKMCSHTKKIIRHKSGEKEQKYLAYVLPLV